MTNRVSMASVEEALKKYLADALVRDIMDDVVNNALDEKSRECGMTYGEWKRRFDDDHQLVWAADSLGGFGKAGWSVYGNADDLRIVKIVSDGNEKVLHLWDDSWGNWLEADTRYWICNCDEPGHRFEGTYHRDDFEAMRADAEKAGYKKCRIYRFDGVSTDGMPIWVLAGRFDWGCE